MQISPKMGIKFENCVILRASNLSYNTPVIAVPITLNIPSNTNKIAVKKFNSEIYSTLS